MHDLLWNIWSVKVHDLAKSDDPRTGLEIVSWPMSRAWQSRAVNVQDLKTKAIAHVRNLPIKAGTIDIMQDSEYVMCVQNLATVGRSMHIAWKSSSQPGRVGRSNVYRTWKARNTGRRWQGWTAN